MIYAYTRPNISGECLQDGPLVLFFLIKRFALIMLCVTQV